MAPSRRLAMGKTQVPPLRFAQGEIVVPRSRSCGNRTCRSVGSVAALVGDLRYPTSREKLA